MTSLNEADQQTLLQIARAALLSYLDSSKIPDVPEPAESLRQHCGAFVSLHQGKRLRGCVGMIAAEKALYLTVGECAVWAGVRDNRFSPVTKQEVSQLNFEISVLSSLVDIAPEDVEVGLHGLVITQGGLRGLLLPQVPLERGWDREQFLEGTCEKAGLPPGAWRHGAQLLAFTAQVFHEASAQDSGRPSE